MQAKGCHWLMVVAGQDTIRSVMMLRMSFDCVVAAFVSTFFASGQGADAYIQSWPGQYVRMCERTNTQTGARTKPFLEIRRACVLWPCALLLSRGREKIQLTHTHGKTEPLLLLLLLNSTIYHKSSLVGKKKHPVSRNRNLDRSMVPKTQRNTGHAHTNTHSTPGDDDEQRCICVLYSK